MKKAYLIMAAFLPLAILQKPANALPVGTAVETVAETAAETPTEPVEVYYTGQEGSKAHFNREEKMALLEFYGGVNFSLFTDPVNRIYIQNKKKFKYSEMGAPDILTVLMKKMDGESPCKTETLDIFINRQKLKIVIEDYHNSPDRTIKVYPLDKKEELGTGLKSVDLYINKNLNPMVPYKILAGHKRKKEPVPFYMENFGELK